PQVSSQPVSTARVTPSITISQLTAQTDRAQPANWSSHMVEPATSLDEHRSSRRDVQFRLAAESSVKILVQHSGWYRVTQPQLLAAGLEPSVDPATLQLFAAGIEQPI